MHQEDQRQIQGKKKKKGNLPTLKMKYPHTQRNPTLNTMYRTKGRRNRHVQEKLNDNGLMARSLPQIWINWKILYNSKHNLSCKKEKGPNAILIVKQLLTEQNINFQCPEIFGKKNSVRNYYSAQKRLETLFKKMVLQQLSCF